jgi:acyl-CoA thioesterase I
MKTACIIPLTFLLMTAQRPVTPDSRPVILAFGDSLSAGYGVPTGAGYPDRLQQKLDTLGYKYRVVNMGISGDTTSGGISRLKAALDQKPSIVILELGANDGLRGLPIDRMRANLDQIVIAFQKAGAKVILAGMTLPRNYGESYVKSFEDVFRDLAKKYTLPLIPFFLEGVAANPQYTLEDLIHPNAQGYVLVTDIVMKTLQPVLKKN